VKKDFALAAQRADRRDRLNRSDLPVRGLDRDEARVLLQRGRDLLDRDETLAVRIDQRDVDAPRFRFLRGGEDGLVLHPAGDEVVAFAEQVQRDVVRFRRAAREVDLVRLHREDARDRDARVFQCVCCFAAVLMRQRGRISEDFGEVRQHRLDHPRIAWCRRVMVEVNRVRHPRMITCDYRREIS
jgi:hypothetical protein